MSQPLLSMPIRGEGDVVLARQRSRTVARLLGFDAQDQTRLATATSEIVRNACRYARSGQVDFLVEGKTAPQVLAIRVTDRGPGIPNLARILRGDHGSAPGMGMGLLGARRLVDRFHVDTSAEGTTVWLRKLLPAGTLVLAPADRDRLTRELARERAHDPLAELEQQNQELMGALADLRSRQDELVRVNQELEDTNRGVVALYAELDERADHLRRADQLKTRFLSQMSHEFRTPLNSILALSRLLLGRTDGDLAPEQVKQVEFVRRAAQDLSDLVADLLDLAKVEAGKTDVRPSAFEVSALFGTLRGLLRPLVASDAVRLVFAEPQGLPPLQTDEAKVSQVLRNFVSNALKFTEQGEIRVSATVEPDAPDQVAFEVVDTGIGIAPQDQERIFLDFVQVESPIQSRVKGTGLGLPLCRKLAHLLGGQVSVTSAVGQGSTFRLTIPRVYVPPGEPVAEGPPPPETWARIAVLVVDDDPAETGRYDASLEGSEFQAVRVRSVDEARRALTRVRPRAILLDIKPGQPERWGFLVEVKSDPELQGTPVLVVTSVEDRAKSLAMGADAYAAEPVPPGWLPGELRELLTRRRVLIIDDDEIIRYLLRQRLPRHEVVEAANGEQGLAEARRQPPDAIVLDLRMPDLEGTEVLERLAGDPATRAIPVVLLTATHLDELQRAFLATRTAAIVSKDTLARTGGDDDLDRALSQLGLAPRGTHV